MGDWFQTQAGTGSLALAIPVALIAGLVSFFSPCVIPLLPGYLSYATGLSGADLASGEATSHRGRMLAGSLLFVLGFTVIFVILGASFGEFGRRLRNWLITSQDEITFVMGGFLILLGLVFAGAIPLLQREWRIHTLPGVGLSAAPLIGAIFALGWTPCIGPTYGVILTLTYQDATAGRGALLSFVYALGLGVPFVIAGLAYRRTLGALAWVRRHQATVMRAGGLMLVVVGVLLMTGWWDQIVSWLQIQLISDFEVVV
jgi:cytochrome c-type biogenesis protein